MHLMGGSYARRGFAAAPLSLVSGPVWHLEAYGGVSIQLLLGRHSAEAVRLPWMVFALWGTPGICLGAPQ